jgi:quercetin dioxygenase-like cupin family protein
MEGKEIVLRPGDVLLIPSNVPHRVIALEGSTALDVFSPIRADWLTGQDDYLRR